jgi:alpha-N-arabinofuranosidase
MAAWFEDHAAMYDSYDRQGPKIYVGEYATKPGAGNGNLNAALGGSGLHDRHGAQ